MGTSRPLRTLVLIWLGWAIVLLGFQAVVPMRLQPQRPDKALSWTPSETLAGSQRNKPYLMEPFLNAQVSWDSEFYLSVATVGYDDANVHMIPGPGGREVTLSYAFFPLYPYVMKVLAAPLRLAGMRPIAASALAGVVVSLLGTLAAMLALYDLAREELQEKGALRAAFYLLIFPMGFFLAQVYTEGLFVGLAFWCLALIRRRRLGWAALLAVGATWTRAVGLGLAIPLGLAWWHEATAKRDEMGFIPGVVWLRGLAPAAPVIAHLVWRASFWGQANAWVESYYFSRGFMLLGQTLGAWRMALESTAKNSQAAVYYGLEIAIIALAFTACLATLRRYPGPALFGLFVVIVSLFSGVAQSVGRYVMVAPSIYLFLSRLGRKEAFDRTWTVASVLLLGLLATLFTYDMWVA